MKHYKLEGHKAVECEDPMEWAKWFETAERKVELTERGDVSVSTVFLGLDHGFSFSHAETGPPIVFETLVFGGEHDGDMTRCSTWDEAVKGHRIMAKKVFGKY